MHDFSRLTGELTPKIVNEFISMNRERYVDTLNMTKEIITEALEAAPIYKIYGRDERQRGEILKEARKIRMKFNDFYSGKSTGSLWDIPDIVGFTIVVAYPSQITTVCKIIDELVDSNTLIAPYPPKPKESEDNTEIIKSKHGRSFVTNGYVGCHYNIRIPKLRNEVQPICEIQIKTVLFDAWGAKTHDLTYKAAAQVDPTLIRGFEILGDTLAKIDLQSDLFRSSIERQHAVRDHYKNNYYRHKIADLLETVYTKVPEFAAKKEQVSAICVRSSHSNLLKVQNDCHKIYQMALEDKASDEDYQKWVAIALFLIGLRCGKHYFLNDAREALLDWEQSQISEAGKLHAIGVSALVNFFGGDKDTAISESERGITLASAIQTEIPESESNKFFHTYLSIVSSLAYYHADLIGSHEGKLRGSLEKASKYLELIEGLNNNMPFPFASSANTEEEILTAVGHPERASSNFMALDNDIYVRILISKNLESARTLHRQLEFLHKNPPQEIEIEAGLLWKYHDYCARVHITELELGYLGSSQP